MKYIFFVSTLILLVSCNNLNINQYTAKNSYKILKIEEYSKYFIIKVTRNDSIFKIVSAKDSTYENNHFGKIQINKLYKLDLQSRNNIKGKLYLINYLDVKCYGFEDTTICYDNDCIPELYYAKNLKGLYLINNNE